MLVLYILLAVIVAVYASITLLVFTTMAISTRTPMFYLGHKLPSLRSLLWIAAQWPLWPWQKDEEEV